MKLAVELLMNQARREEVQEQRLSELQATADAARRQPGSEPPQEANCLEPPRLVRGSVRALCPFFSHVAMKAALPAALLSEYAKCKSAP